ncbi:PD-(D/E)XK nuclease family protein [Pseudomonas sp. RL]|uniref:PD-(D/E)XK nuclease family protein n=1 Tax=Pseudomonas sp. RL TaxID=1452718 RepID=UPI00068D6E22|nr:PD-(D/E)XK nuclease family protein [Pseudomonas sp. RL]
MTDSTFNPAAFGSGKVAVPPTVAPPPDTTVFNPGALRAQLQAKQQAILDLRTAPLGTVPTWSMSRLFDFEDCPHKVYLSVVAKMPSPSGPAAERGTQIHNHIEGYIQAEHSDVIKEMQGFLPLINLLREEYAEARVEVEGDWGFTRTWGVTGWTGKDVWARMKLDAIHFESPTSAKVIDWKTGKKWGNEIKHGQQGMGYAIGAFARYPELELISVQFAYLDKGEELRAAYTRRQADLMRPMLERRADVMTTSVTFDPKPSFHACRFCPHAKVQEGRSEPACPWADEHVTH